jgi:hypothetical protein
MRIRTLLAVMFQLADYQLRFQVFDGVANAFKAGLHLGPQGLHGLGDAAIAIDQHRQRKNNCDGEGEKLRVSHST